MKLVVLPELIHTDAASFAYKLARTTIGRAV